MASNSPVVYMPSVNRPVRDSNTLNALVVPESNRLQPKRKAIKQHGFGLLQR